MDRCRHAGRSPRATVAPSGTAAGETDDAGCAHAFRRTRPGQAQAIRLHKAESVGSRAPFRG
eukprot:4893536-Pleurochrysis_carterae.AAC.2